MVKSKFPLPLLVTLYVILWVPQIGLLRGVTLLSTTRIGHPVTGLEVLPTLTLLTTVTMWLFIAASGWWRDAHSIQILGLRIPCATSWRLLAACAATLLALSTPLSFTFASVSVPFIQLLMKGGGLFMAPIADVLTRRRVEPTSYVALALVAVGLTTAIHARGLAMPPLCIVVIGMYIAGYAGRLYCMSKVAKTDDPKTLRRYFVEEQIAAWPMSVIVGAILILLGRGSAFDQLRWGATHLWSSPVLPILMLAAIGTCTVGALSLLILLSPRENSFCVPLERSASVLGGLAASYVLSWLFGLTPPTGSELIGAAFLIAAVVVLSVASAPSARIRVKPTINQSSNP